MAKTKVIEIESVHGIRRFADQLTYFRHGVSLASRVIQEDGKWFIWNGDGWIECEEPEIVTYVEQLNRQELWKNLNQVII